MIAQSEQIGKAGPPAPVRQVFKISLKTFLPGEKTPLRLRWYR